MIPSSRKRNRGRRRHWKVRKKDRQIDGRKGIKVRKEEKEGKKKGRDITSKRFTGENVNTSKSWNSWKKEIDIFNRVSCGLVIVEPACRDENESYE